MQDDLLDIAKGLEEVALNDDYFIERKYAERGFYTGYCLPCDGLPHPHVHGAVRAGTPAGMDRPLARDARGPDHKIGRPRQLYTGYTERDYVQMGDR